MLKILAELVRGNPKVNATPSAATLYRSKKKVLLLDEVDRLRNADKEAFGSVLAVLNVGFEKGGAIERMEKIRGGKFEVTEFEVYRPVALAGIESLADTLSDRCFPIKMERAIDRLPRFSIRVMEELFVQLRNGFERWAEQNGGHVEATYENLPDEMAPLKNFDDRFQDIAEPLLVIAALADEERPEGPAVLPRLLEALEAAAGRREPSGRERELLAFLDILDPLVNGVEKVFIASSVLLEKCQEREELSRIETGRALAGFLKHFDLYPGFNAKKTERGYSIGQTWMDEWRSRYASRTEWES
jgi:hypothetical protein